MKLGFDIHGVLDIFEIFPKLINQLIDDPSIEIHVITGLARAEADDVIGELIDLSRVKYFSIADYLMDQPDVDVTWDENGLPWADETAWNNAKANYCEAESIDILFDDSPAYIESFNNISTLYCQVHNPNRKRFRD